MGPEKLFALGIIFAVLSPAPSLPALRELHYNGGALGSLKKLCKSACVEAKGNSKFHDSSLTCFCEVPKTTTDVTANLLTKKAQENGMGLEIIKRNSNAKRETNTLELLDDKVSPNAAEKHSPFDFDDFMGQAAPNTVPQRQHQSAKGSEPTEVSNQRPPNISNKKTEALSEVVKEMEHGEMDTKDVQDEKVKQVFPKRDFLGQASPNTVPQRQQANGKESAPAEPIEVSSQRPPNISNKKTSASSEVVKQMEAPNLSREMNAKDVQGNKANKSQMPPQLDFDDFLGQASPNTAPQRQQQIGKGSVPVEPTEVNNQRPPNISNKKTSASEVVRETKPEGPNLKRKMNEKDMRGANKRHFDFENFLSQASPNTAPQRQQQNAKGSPPAESTDVNNRRPPTISNKKTTALSEEEAESEAQREIDDKVSQFSMVDKRRTRLEDMPQRQHQTESESPKEEPANANNQRPPNITNRKTSILPEEEVLHSTEIRDAELLLPSGHNMRRSTPNLKEMNKLQDDGVTNLERGINLEDPLKSSDSEGVIGQASPNTTPQRQQQNMKGSVLPEASGSQRPPRTEDLTNKKISSTSSTTENFVGASSDLLVNMVGEGEPISSSRQTTRRSTPSPRKATSLRRTTYNSEPIRRALESARQHIDTLIQRANQPSFNPSTVGAEIEAICATLRSVSHRVNESARNLERSALMEQIRERERERHARIHSRFGGHEDRPRKLKPLLVGSGNPKDKGAVGKTPEESQGRKETAQKGSTIITQPPELIED